MSRLAEWCDEAAYAHWAPNGDLVPSWPEAYEHLVSEGLCRVCRIPPLIMSLGSLLSPG